MFPCQSSRSLYPLRPGVSSVLCSSEFSESCLVESFSESGSCCEVAARSDCSDELSIAFSGSNDFDDPPFEPL